MKPAHDRHGVRLHAEGGKDQRHPRQAPEETTKGEALRRGAGVKAEEGEQAELEQDEAEHGEIVRARPRRRDEGRAREGEAALRLEDVEGKEGPDEREESEEERGQTE